MEKVTFKTPNVTSIISPYYGSILDDLEALNVPLDNDFVKRFRVKCENSQEQQLSDDTEHAFTHHKYYAAVKETLGEHKAALTNIDRLSQVFDSQDEKIVNNLFRVIAFPYWYGERLRLASERGGLAIVSDLVDRGCSPLSGDGNGVNSIHRAACTGQVETLKYLISKSLLWNPSESSIVNCCDKSDWTPLMFAVQYLQPEAVSLLLDNPAILVNAKSQYGKTSLHFSVSLAAVSTTGIKILTLLLNHGADPYICDNYGQNCLDLASSFDIRQELEDWINEAQSHRRQEEDEVLAACQEEEKKETKE